MKILFNGKEIASVITNRSITIEEALFVIGYDVHSPEDCEKAYSDGFPAAYLDDCGNCAIDVDALELEY